MASDPPQPESPEAQLRRLVPAVRRDGTIVFGRRVGRPRQVRRAPDPGEIDYQAEVATLVEDFIAGDDMVRAAAVGVGRDDTTVLDATLMEIAREAAGLAFERARMMSQGKDIGQVSSRRIDALSRLATIVAARARLGGRDEIDPRDPRVQTLAQLFHDAVCECAHEVMPEGVAKNFVRKYMAGVEGWEERVER